MYLDTCAHSTKFTMPSFPCAQLYDLDAIRSEDSPPAAAAVATYTPLHTLQPPHYDAVTSFAVHSRFLYSACGVTIKQWDMKLQSLKQVGVALCAQEGVVY